MLDKKGPESWRPYDVCFADAPRCGRGQCSTACLRTPTPSVRQRTSW